MRAAAPAARASMKRKLPGIGKPAIAPCGHAGEHVTSLLILCDESGCDSKPWPARFVPVVSAYDCAHAVRVTFAGTTSCRLCGKVFRTP